jgi:hypothetical protein
LLFAPKEYIITPCGNRQKWENGPDLGLIMTQENKNDLVIYFYFEKLHKI